MMIIVKRRRMQGYAHEHIAAVRTSMKQSGSHSASTRSAVRSTTIAGAGGAFGQQAASRAATGNVAAAAAGILTSYGHSAIYAKDVKTRHNVGIRTIKKKIRSYIYTHHDQQPRITSG
jgi:hypothetical protein